MSLLPDIFARIESHLRASGRFDNFTAYEPKGAPGHGLSAAMWLGKIETDAERSGLAASAGRITINIRLYTSMLADPQDATDPALAEAVHDVLLRLHADLTLGGLVQSIDLLGMGARGLDAEAGYLNQDSKLFRVAVITVPCLVSDLWPQEA